MLQSQKAGVSLIVIITSFNHSLLKRWLWRDPALQVSLVLCDRKITGPGKANKKIEMLLTPIQLHLWCYTYRPSTLNWPHLHSNKTQTDGRRLFSLQVLLRMKNLVTTATRCMMASTSHGQLLLCQCDIPQNFSFCFLKVISSGTQNLIAISLSNCLIQLGHHIS